MGGVGLCTRPRNGGDRMKKGKLIVRPLPPPGEGQPMRALPEWRHPRDDILFALMLVILPLGLALAVYAPIILAH